MNGSFHPSEFSVYIMYGAYLLLSICGVNYCADDDEKWKLKVAYSLTKLEP